MASETTGSMIWMSLAALACLVLCQASILDCFGKKKGNKLDTLDKLDELIVGLTRWQGLPENVNAARKFVESPAFEEKDADLKQAVLWYSKIKPDEEHLCEANNWSLIRNLFGMVSKGNKFQITWRLEYDTTKSRLLEQLRQFAKKAKKICFKKLNESWSLISNRDSISKLKPSFKHFGYLTIFQNVEKDINEEEVKELDRATNMLIENSKKEQLSTNYVSSLLRLIYEDLTGLSWTKLNQEGKLDLVGTRQLIESYLVQPCKSLESHKEETEILDTVLNLGQVLRLDDSIKPNLARTHGEKTFQVATWASYRAVCQQLLQMDLAKLASKVLLNSKYLETVLIEDWLAHASRDGTDLIPPNQVIA